MPIVTYSETRPNGGVRITTKEVSDEDAKEIKSDHTSEEIEAMLNLDAQITPTTK